VPVCGPGGSAPPRAQDLFHFFVQNRFDHLPYPFPDRFFQALSPQTGLVFHLLRGTFLHGVFLLFLTALQGSSGFCFNRFQEKTPFLFLLSTRIGTGPQKKA
jgi:hypothetical protein